MHARGLVHGADPAPPLQGASVSGQLLSQGKPLSPFATPVGWQG